MSRFGFGAHGCKLLALAGAAVLTLTFQCATHAQSESLRLNALAQEGDLLLEEGNALEPTRQKLEDEGEKLRAEEKSLRADVHDIGNRIKAFNAQMDKFNEELKAQQEACPEQSKDPEVVASCNQKVVELRQRAQKLDALRVELADRQRAVNQRVDAYNSKSADYNKRKQADDARGKLNDRDVQDWLTRVREFFASDDFKTMSDSPLPIPACDEDNIGSLETLPPPQSLKRAHACLKAVQAISH